jgi:hypothetical protein
MMNPSLYIKHIGARMSLYSDYFLAHSPASFNGPAHLLIHRYGIAIGRSPLDLQATASKVQPTHRMHEKTDSVGRIAEPRTGELMKTSSRAGRSPILACLLMVFAVAAQAESSDPAGTVVAVWKVQQMNFAYHGYGTLYTCGALRDKLHAILKGIGARDGIKISAYDCDEETGRARFQITLASPVEATAENLHALTRYDSRQELIALSRGEPLPTEENLPRFTAVWKTVSFARDRKLKLAAADCELVQQLQREILPRLSVQVVRDNLFCSHAFGNISPPRLTVAALVEDR